MRRLLLVLLLCVLSVPASAVQPDEILKDPALEARAREVGKDLRCLVCQNQSIDDSDADLARDLRVLVRERIVAGDSNREVIDYVVSRYSDFVLLNPPFKLKTYALWFGPAIIIAFGLFAIFVFFRRRGDDAAGGAPDALSEAEKEKLSRLIDGEGR
jgi:cytochrome c-type biogenesis protein CcmH